MRVVRSCLSNVRELAQTRDYESLSPDRGILRPIEDRASRIRACAETRGAIQTLFLAARECLKKIQTTKDQVVKAIGFSMRKVQMGEFNVSMRGTLMNILSERVL